MSEGKVKPSTPVVAEAHDVDTFRESRTQAIRAKHAVTDPHPPPDPPQKMFESKLSILSPAERSHAGR